MRGQERGKGMRLLLLVAAAIGLLEGCVRSPEDEARERRGRAEAYREARQYREASVEYQAAVQANPKDVEAFYGLAKVLEALGQIEQYRNTLRRALTANPEHVPANVDMSALLWASGNYEEALELAARARRLEPASAVAARMEARALADLGRREEAWAAWQGFLELGPEEARDYLEVANFQAWVGDPDGAREVLEQGLERFPRSEDLLLGLADLLALRGDAAGAEDALRRAEAGEGASPRVHAARARLLVRTGRPLQAMVYLQESQDGMAGDPGREPAMALERARLLLQLGEEQGAAHVLEKARTRYPEDAGISALLADLWISQGKTDEARALLPVAERFDPTGRIARLLEARLYLKDGRSYWALLVLEPLVAQGDLSVDTHFLYARALAGERRWAQARREYTRLLRRHPDHALLRLDFATLLRLQGDFPGALALLEGLPTPLADSAQVQFVRAQILVDQRDHTRARAAASRLLEAAPDNPLVLKLVGDAEATAGRYSQAIGFYRRAQQQSPKAVEPVLAEAEALLRQGAARKEVIRTLREHIARQGETAALLNRVAQLNLEDGNLSAASATLGRSLLLEPNHQSTRVLHARILLAGGEEGKALVELQEAINLNPHAAEPYNVMAEIYQRRGETARAEESYRRLLDRVPGEPRTANNLANLYLAHGKVSEALRLAQAAYAGAPRDPRVLDTLGWALERSGRSEEAVPLLEAVVESLPDHPEALFHWGMNLRSRGRGAEARGVLERVVSLWPTSEIGQAAKRVLEDLPR